MTEPIDDAEWDERLRYWRRKLGRLRLEAEPIDAQVARYRRVTVMLTAAPAVIALMFLGLFTAFGRPDVGAVLVAVLLGPVVAVAWLDFALLQRRAAGYLRDLRDHEARRAGVKSPGGA